MDTDVLGILIKLEYVTMYHLPTHTVPVLTEEGLEFLERNFDWAEIEDAD